MDNKQIAGILSRAIFLNEIPEDFRIFGIDVKTGEINQISLEGIASYAFEWFAANLEPQGFGDWLKAYLNFSVTLPTGEKLDVSIDKKDHEEVVLFG